MLTCIAHNNTSCANRDILVNQLHLQFTNVSNLIIRAILWDKLSIYSHIWVIEIWGGFTSLPIQTWAFGTGKCAFTVGSYTVYRRPGTAETRYYSTVGFYVSQKCLVQKRHVVSFSIPIHYSLARSISIVYLVEVNKICGHVCIVG